MYTAISTNVFFTESQRKNSAKLPRNCKKKSQVGSFLCSIVCGLDPFRKSFSLWSRVRLNSRTWLIPGAVPSTTTASRSLYPLKTQGGANSTLPRGSIILPHSLSQLTTPTTSNHHTYQKTRPTH